MPKPFAPETQTDETSGTRSPARRRRSTTGGLRRDWIHIGIQTAKAPAASAARSLKLTPYRRSGLMA